MKCVDVNVLIYAHFAAAPEHEAYAALVRELADSDAPWAMSELVMSGFLRVATHGAAFEAVSIPAALEFLDELIDRPNVTLIRPGADHWRIFRKLVEGPGVKGKLVSDAFHAALAIEHGCEWLSADADFGRFKGLRWSHPLRG